MCNEESMNCIHLGQLAFDCFLTLFLSVNVTERNLQLDNEEQTVITLVTNFDGLKGLKTLWKITMVCMLDSVKEKARDTLCDLYIMHQPQKNNSYKLRTSLMMEFIAECNKNIELALNQGHQDVVVACIKLLRNYIHRFDKCHLTKELRSTIDNLTQAEQKQLKVITVTLSPDNLKVRVQVNNNCKFWQLMFQMSEFFNLKMSEFYIIAKNGPLNNITYNDYMRNYNISDISMQRVVPEAQEKQQPNFVIGYD